MKIAVIGAQGGHYNDLIEAMKRNPAMSVDAIAPGSIDENIVPIAMDFNRAGVKPKLFDNYFTMLDEIKPDLVALCSYFYLNSQIATDLLRRQISVFCENPLATELNKLDNLYNEYQKSGVHFTAMHLMRYMPCFYTAYKAVRKGLIGDIAMINIQKSCKLEPKEEFFKNRFTYGGTIPWLGAQAIDLAYWFADSPFKSVRAIHTTKHNNSYGDLENAALCHFVTENDIVISVDIDYMRPQTAPYYEDDRMRITGTKGVIEVINSKTYIINENESGIQKLPLIDAGNLFEDFMNQVKGFGRCRVTALDTFYVARSCLMARNSADMEKTVVF